MIPIRDLRSTAREYLWAAKLAKSRSKHGFVRRSTGPPDLLGNCQQVEAATALQPARNENTN